MKGLILKDIYVFGKSMRGYIGVIVAFLLAPFAGETWAFMSLFDCMMVGAMAQSLISLDERSKWQSYVATMPVKKSDYVSSKYILTLIVTGVVMAASAILNMICVLTTDYFRWADLIRTLAMQFSISCLAVAIQLPWVFKYSVEKARIAYYVMVLFVTGGSILGVYPAGWLSGCDALEGPALLGLCLLSAVVYASAWWLSIRFYEEREV